MKKRILSLFPRHVVPDELSLLSIYEIVAYLAILFFCYTLFQQWTTIPVIQKDIFIERLDSLNVASERNATLASINYELPISSIFDGPDPKSTVTFSMLETKGKEVCYDGYVDSLYNVFIGHKPSVATRIYPTFYHCYYAYAKNVNVNKIDTSLFGYYQYNNISEIETASHRHLWSIELFAQGPEVSTSTQINDPSLGKPRFFSRRDISQAYFKMRVHSHTIDSIDLCFNYLGAIDVIPMGDYYPSLVVSNSVKYSLSPIYQKELTNNWTFSTSEQQFPKMYENGLIYEDGTEVFFLVKYRDLENVQNRRVFLVTAVMSGLITIFIAFIIIFVYRVVRLLAVSIKKKKDDIDEEEREEMER